MTNQNSSPVQGVTEIAPKLRAGMYFSYGRDGRPGLQSSSTFEAILAGERTSTTRFSNWPQYDSYAMLQPGDRLRFYEQKGMTGRHVDVIVTEVPKKITLSNCSQDQLAEWSQAEGWSETAGRRFGSQNGTGLNIRYRLAEQSDIGKKLEKPITPRRRAVLFLSGSISIAALDKTAKDRIEDLVGKGLSFIVGDANGADKAIQTTLKAANATSVTVFCSSQQPPNIVGNWPIEKVEFDQSLSGRAFFEVKDNAMAQRADAAMMIWDCRSPGTLNNIINMVRQNKKSLVYIAPEEKFCVIAEAADLHALIARMSVGAREAAESKIQLTERLKQLSPSTVAVPAASTTPALRQSLANKLATRGTASRDSGYGR